MAESKSYYTLFDQQSESYSRFRPSYPAELFEFLAGLTAERELAWDVGTGSGQAASMLAEYFERVHATDSSESQVSQAPKHERITYKVTPAESSELADSSCDLITVASALHWFDRDAFYAEAKRSLKNGGVLAVWCYSLVVPPQMIEKAIEEFYAQIEEFWPAPIQLVKDHYRTIEFPFAEIAAPEFTIRESRPISELLGFYSSWSAVQAFKTQRGEDPIAELAAKIAAIVDLDTSIELNLPLYLRVGNN
jgi:ubiquinone/menaquinone biosynthesis C-methylase UbiE